MNQPMPSLSATHRQHLMDTSAIADHIIAERGYVSITPGAITEWRQMAGHIHSDKLLKSVLHQGALAFPVHRLGHSQPYTWVLRPEQPRTRNGKLVKYEWPDKTTNIFDALPRYKQALSDPTIPLWITEGTKKADALASLYDAAIVPVNENGVWGWRGTNQHGGKTAIPDFDDIAWNGRQVVIAPDGDIKFNKQVKQAIQRLARLLTAHGVAEVLILELPMHRNGPKIGVDDYLAQGHTKDALEQHLSDLGSVAQATRTPFGTHPDTDEDLYLPPGYDIHHQSIVRIDGNGKPQQLYSGCIYVQETGTNLHTQDETATVTWNGRGHPARQVTIPRATFTDMRAFGPLVGGAGAVIHPRNMRDVSTFLVEFAQENYQALPHRAHVDQYGVVNDGVVLPAGTIGFTEDVQYIGDSRVTVGTDADVYPRAIREALSWSNAWSFWLSLALSLASPAIARLRPRRNPVMYDAGGSGSGKTTKSQFATGCWGDPTRAPFRIEAGRTTPAGLIQTVDRLNGLPVFVDEAHTIPRPDRLELACYNFANGQRYTIGSGDGTARGGGNLVGTLLLAGEALPIFRNAGAQLRVLWADADTWYPLGAPARSIEGQRRAQMLEAAWHTGAGLFGFAVTHMIWNNWTTFTKEVAQVEHLPQLAPLLAWRQPLAIALVTLSIALEVAEVTTTHLPYPDTWQTDLLNNWVAMLHSGHNDADPATDAWERLMVMLAQGQTCSNATTTVPATWEWIEADRGGGMIACRYVAGDGHWRVLTKTPQFIERVGPSVVQQHGQAWKKRQWIVAGRDGKATSIEHTYIGTKMRVLVIPAAMLEDWSQTI